MIIQLGKGGQARIFKAERIVDGKMFALKMMQPKSMKEKDSFLNEFRIFSSFESDQILKVEDVFVWQRKIFAFLDLMDGGSFTNIVLTQ